MYAIYKGTDKEALYPPYSGFLIDQNYQVDGWINIDHLIHAALGNDFAYDEEASFSLRTKAFVYAKRVMILMMLSYVNDMFSLGSYNKLTDFGVKVVDRTTDQEIDLINVQTNIVGQIGNNIMSIYTGPLKYDLTRVITSEVTVNKQNVNQCNKKYINKCDGVIFTMKDSPEAVDDGCPVCYKHDIAVQVRVNPHADTRINKPDIQNTIDPIHWTAGLSSETCVTSSNVLTSEKGSNYDSFKGLVSEFGEKTYTVGSLNESRAFASSDGTFEKGIVVGGFAHNENNDAVQRSSMELWNGTSWCLGENMSVGRSLGIFGGDSDQAIYAFGASVTYASSPTDEYNKKFYPSSISLNLESSTTIWNGTSWITPSPYTFTGANVARHSAAGKMSIKITETDENKNPVESHDLLKPRTLFQDDFLMTNRDYFPLTAQLQPRSDTDWYAFTRFDGIAFGGCTSNSFNLLGASENDVLGIFEFASWGGLIRNTFNVAPLSAGSTISEVVTSSRDYEVKVGTWFVDPTRRYPVNAYGMCYVGNIQQGLSTGGKTGKNPDTYLNIYSDSSKFNEFDNPVLNLCYEYNGTTWIRRDNMEEEVYYHTGVGDKDYAVFWGGIHPSPDTPHIYDSTETYEDWEVIVSRLGGSVQARGSYGVDGELRYAMFPTLSNDEEGNKWYQLGDSRDYTSIDKPLLCTTETTGVYENFNPSDVNATIANKHNIQISRIINDSTLEVTTYFDGESWKSNKIRAGDRKLIASREFNNQVAEFSYENENDALRFYDGNYIPTTSGTNSGVFIPYGVFAPKYNTKNSIILLMLVIQ
jgi:hypothetical protein